MTTNQPAGGNEITLKPTPAPEVESTGRRRGFSTMGDEITIPRRPGGFKCPNDSGPPDSGPNDSAAAFNGTARARISAQAGEA